VHHQAKLPSGLTVLERAIIEHNIEAVTHIYNSISFTELGALLETPPSRAEQILSNMVLENRIQATLDQL